VPSAPASIRRGSAFSDRDSDVREYLHQGVEQLVAQLVVIRHIAERHLDVGEQLRQDAFAVARRDPGLVLNQQRFCARREDERVLTVAADRHLGSFRSGLITN
jgi:hypothetical protein